MNNPSWGFTQNPFLNSTANSFKKMNMIVADHLAKLNAEVNDPLIVPLIARMQPAKAAWEAAFGHWKAVQGNQEGETQRFTDMLRELSSVKIKEWDIRIQAVFIEGHPDYRVLLPNRRKAFQLGAYESRIAEVYALRERLGAYPSLVSVQGDVSVYYTRLVNARDIQQQKDGLVKDASNLVEIERVNIAQVMYLILSALMAKYYTNTSRLEHFFDLELIRSTGQGNDEEAPQPQSGTVGAGSIANLLNGTFAAADVFTLTNTGTAPLTFYLAASPTDAMAQPTTGILLQPGDTASHSALEFGADFMPCLNVHNDSTGNAGSWELLVG